MKRAPTKTTGDGAHFDQVFIFDCQSFESVAGHFHGVGTKIRHEAPIFRLVLVVMVSWNSKRRCSIRKLLTFFFGSRRPLWEETAELVSTTAGYF